MPTPDLKKIKLYLLRYAEDDFFGQYKDGSRHYFRLKNDRSGWDIIPYGTPLWDSLDQDAWFGTDIDEWYGEGSSHIPPDWLPDLPSVKELEAVPSVLWTDRYSSKKKLKTEEYRYVANYMKEKNEDSLKVFLLFRKESDTQWDEPTVMYLDDVFLQPNDKVQKSCTIVLGNEEFSIPDHHPEYPEKYKESDVLWKLDTKLFMEQFEFFRKSDGIVYLRILKAPYRVFRYFSEKHDWIRVTENNDAYNEIIQHFNSIPENNTYRILNGEEHAQLNYYRRYKKDYLFKL